LAKKIPVRLTLLLGPPVFFAEHLVMGVRLDFPLEDTMSPLHLLYENPSTTSSRTLVWCRCLRLMLFSFVLLAFAPLPFLGFTPEAAAQDGAGADPDECFDCVDSPGPGADEGVLEDPATWYGTYFWRGFNHRWSYNHRLNRLGDWIKPGDCAGNGAVVVSVGDVPDMTCETN
jgi:hypothetical protein